MKKENRLLTPHCLTACAECFAWQQISFFFRKSIEISVCQFACSNKETCRPLTLPFLMAYICKANCSNSASLLRAIATCHMQLASCTSEMQKSFSINNFQHLQRVAPACRKPIGWCNAREGGRGHARGVRHATCMQSMGHANVTCSSVWRDSRLKVLTPLWLFQQGKKATTEQERRGRIKGKLE